MIAARTTVNTKRYLIAVLDAGHTSLQQQVQMWLDELEDEPDLFDTQVCKITKRIERLLAEAQLHRRWLDALEVWTSVDVDDRDIEAIQLLIDRYDEQRERAQHRANALWRSPWEHEVRKGDACEDRAANLTKYIDLLKQALR